MNAMSMQISPITINLGLDLLRYLLIMKLKTIVERLNFVSNYPTGTNYPLRSITAIGSRRESVRTVVAEVATRTTIGIGAV